MKALASSIFALAAAAERKPIRSSKTGEKGVKVVAIFDSDRLKETHEENARHGIVWCNL